MASIFKNGKRWRVAVVIPNGKRITRTFDLKSDAQAWGRAREAEIDAGTWGVVVNRKLTLAEYAPQWLEAQEWKPSTRDNTRGHVTRYILPELGNQPIASITNTQVRGWVTKLSTDGHAPRSVKAYLRTLTAMLSSAVADGVIAFNPATAKRIRTPRPVTRTAEHPLEVLTLEQITAVANHVPSHLQAFVWVGAAAGLRPGETAGLTVGAIDLPGRELRVERQMGTTSEGTGFGPLKTPTSRRTIPIPDALVEHLERHMAEHPPQPFDGHQLVFTTARRRPHYRNSYRRHWAAARDDLGLDPINARGFQDLRHFYASALISSGASVKTVQSLMGHASAMVTLDTYGHLWPDSDVGARDAIATALAG